MWAIPVPTAAPERALEQSRRTAPVPAIPASAIPVPTVAEAPAPASRILIVLAPTQRVGTTSAITAAVDHVSERNPVVILELRSSAGQTPAFRFTLVVPILISAATIFIDATETVIRRTRILYQALRQTVQTS